MKKKNTENECPLSFLLVLLYKGQPTFWNEQLASTFWLTDRLLDNLKVPVLVLNSDFDFSLPR